MGMTTRAAIADGLVEGGRAPDTPVAVIAARDDAVRAACVRTTLAGLADVDLGPPAVIVVGPVAALGLAAGAAAGPAGRPHRGGDPHGPAGRAGWSTRSSGRGAACWSSR